MLSLTIICVDKLREPYLRAAAAEYEKRLGGYCRLRTVEVQDDAGILAALPPRAYKVALCIEGRQLSSEELAERDALRREYLDEWRKGAIEVLENTYVQTPDGKKHKLRRKDEK